MESLLLLPGRGTYAVPGYSTLCRRQHPVSCEVSRRPDKGENPDIAIDSTGLKVYGEGGRKVLRHGWSKCRTWRELHAGIDVNTQEIAVAGLTGNEKDDAATAKTMLKGATGRIRSFRGDGTYDDPDFRKVLGPEVHQIVPPPKDTVIRKGTKKKPHEEYLYQRNRAVEYIHQNGRKAWKVEQGYHRRSLNEVVMVRYKTISGRNQAPKKQKAGLPKPLRKCSILNWYTALGMPDSVKAV